MNSAQGYILKQLEYIEKNKTFPPDVLTYWSEGTSPQVQQKLHKEASVEYYHLWLSMISASFFGDIRSAEYIMRTLRTPDGRDLMIEVVQSFPLSEDGNREFENWKNLLLEGLLIPLLNIFQGLEYQEIQEMIYACLYEIHPIDSQLTIESLRVWNNTRRYNMKKFGI